MFNTKVEKEQNKIHLELVSMNNINLKKIRKSKGYTQKELASKLGISDSTLAHYETGIRKITLEMFLKILNVCHLKIEIKETMKK